MGWPKSPSLAGIISRRWGLRGPLVQTGWRGERQNLKERKLQIPTSVSWARRGLGLLAECLGGELGKDI